MLLNGMKLWQPVHWYAEGDRVRTTMGSTYECTRRGASGKQCPVGMLEFRGLVFERQPYRASKLWWIRIRGDGLAL